ncbi:MAG: phage tail tape measure protein, partial [Clostridia bacterium]
AGSAIATVVKALAGTELLESITGLWKYEGLALLGTAIAGFSTSVTGNVSAGDVTNASTAGITIANLIISLYNSGFKMSMNSLKGLDFTTITSVGGAIAGFSRAISGVSFEIVNAAVSATNRLVAMLTGMSAITGTEATGFKTAMSTLGTVSITTFVTAVNTSAPQAVSAVNNMITAITTAVTGKTEAVKLAFTTLVTAALTALKNKYLEFYTVGQRYMTWMISGIKLKQAGLNTAFAVAISGALTTIRNYYWNFYNAGSYLVDGFANGITANTFKAEAAAAAMADAAYRAAMNKIESKSPSRLFMEVGGYVASGFAIGIGDGEGTVRSSARAMAETAINTTKGVIARLAETINGDLDTQPTIRPVLDLSSVESGVSRLSALFSAKQAIRISSDMNRENVESQNGVHKPTPGNTYQFTQNNYSPKAISRIDIYRQTRNQFSAMKGLVEPT